MNNRITEEDPSLVERLNQVNNWIVNCDQKSGILLAFLGVMVPLVFTNEFFFVTNIKINCSD